MSIGQIRVLIVDDSAVVRGLIAKSLSAVPDIVVGDTATNGQQALNLLKSGKFNVIILDIEMPEMDGMTALQEIMKLGGEVQVIMISTLLNSNAELATKALSLGAADYLRKPSSADGVDAMKKFQQELITKVLLLGGQKSDVALTLPEPLTMQSTNVKLLDLPVSRADAIAIGSSTGGPQALFKVFETLGKAMPDLPVFITQHMPPVFTKGLASQIAKHYGVKCVEAEDGVEVAPSTVYVAPGDFHMVVEMVYGKKIIRITKGEPENFCRPAVDPMLRSLSKVYGKNLIAAILTGMGQDGLLGAKNVVAAGGTVIAQDEASSVVWGMPGVVARAGICKAVLPVTQVGEWLLKNLRGAE